MRRFPVLVISISLFYGIGLIYSHSINRLYPSILIGGGLVSIAYLLYLYIEDKSTVESLFPYHLVGILGFSLMHRFVLFAFPASIVEVDPNWYARTTDAVVATGSTSPIDVPFYEIAPLSILLPSIVSLISGLPGRDAIVVYPFFMGFIVPLVVTVVLRSWMELDTRFVLAFVLLSTVTVMTVKFSFMPMANGMAVAYWLVFLITIPFYEGPKSLASIPTILVLVALVFTHKIGILIPLAAIFSILLVRKGVRWVDCVGIV